MRSAVDSQYGATTVAAESLIAQLHSKGSSLRRAAKIEKFDTKFEILKAKEHASYV
jgi:hypothetical protein